MAGIPVSRVTELASLEGVGKSYLAAQICANAQKMNIYPVYFDSESAGDQIFLEKSGCSLSEMLYVQAVSIEKVFETIEELLKHNKQYLFVIDSLANCPTESDIEGTFNPQESMALKARILSKVFSKLNIPLCDTQSTLLILNQLKTQLIQPDDASPNRQYWTLSQKYTTPGGKSTAYNYSLRIWLTKPNKNDDFVLDEKGFRIGSSVKARLIKSRFGSEGRSCEFKIGWGDQIGVLDEESLMDAISSSEYLETGAWNRLKYSDGTEKVFRSSEWVSLMKEDEKFKNRVMEILDEEIVRKFNDRTTNASSFYDNNDDVELQTSTKER